MKRSIAMRCTQEQFDRIKDKINHSMIRDFEKYSYLISSNSIGLLTNSELLYRYVETHEQWDENIFLEACGIETEKIEYQWFNRGKWINCHSEIRIKPKYDKEIEQIKSLAKEIGYNLIFESIK